MSDKLIQQAIDNQLLYELFIGEHEKSFSNYGSVPTDGEFIFNSWIAYLKNNPHRIEQLWSDYIQTMIRISRHAELSWFAMQYLFSFLDFHRMNGGYLDRTQQVIDEIVINIYQHKAQLQND